MASPLPEGVEFGGGDGEPRALCVQAAAETTSQTGFSLLEHQRSLPGSENRFHRFEQIGDQVDDLSKTAF